MLQLHRCLTPAHATLDVILRNEWAPSIGTSEHLGRYCPGLVRCSRISVSASLLRWIQSPGELDEIGQPFALRIRYFSINGLPSRLATGPSASRVCKPRFNAAWNRL